MRTPSLARGNTPDQPANACSFSKRSFADLSQFHGLQALQPGMQVCPSQCISCIPTTKSIALTPAESALSLSTEAMAHSASTSPVLLSRRAFLRLTGASSYTHLGLCRLDEQA